MNEFIWKETIHQCQYYYEVIEDKEKILAVLYCDRDLSWSINIYNPARGDWYWNIGKLPATMTVEEAKKEIEALF
jgi:hypothetical protein